MVIRSTSALDVIIHAVSPEFIGSGGGAAAHAVPHVAANAATADTAPTKMRVDCALRILLKLP
jgi:hypothetical protein